MRDDKLLCCFSRMRSCGTEATSCFTVRWECVPGARTQQPAPLCVAHASLEHGSSSLFHCATPILTNNINQELQTVKRFHSFLNVWATVRTISTTCPGTASVGPPQTSARLGHCPHNSALVVHKNASAQRRTLPVNHRPDARQHRTGGHIR